jgi:hypothetical protein
LADFLLGFFKKLFFSKKLIKLKFLVDMFVL